MENLDNATKSWFKKIRAAYVSRDLLLAASLAEQAIHETRQSPVLSEIAGVIAFERGEYRDAARLIESAMFEIRLSYAGQMVLCKAWLKIGQNEFAETGIAFLVECIDDLPCALLADLTIAAAELKRYDLALSVCRAAFARHPCDDNAAFGAAFYMQKLGYPPELVKNVLAKAIELNPESHVYRLNYVAICVMVDHWREAYVHACKLPLDALASIPCECSKQRMRELFERFNDSLRLESIDK